MCICEELRPAPAATKHRALACFVASTLLMTLKIFLWALSLPSAWQICTDQQQATEMLFGTGLRSSKAQVTLHYPMHSEIL